MRYPGGEWIVGARLHQLVEHRLHAAGAGSLQHLNATMARGPRARRMYQDPYVQLSDVLSCLDLPGCEGARRAPIAVLCSTLRSLSGSFRSASRVPTHLLGPTVGSLEYLLKVLGRGMCFDQGTAGRDKVQVLVPWRDWDALEAMPTLLTRLERDAPWSPSGKLAVGSGAWSVGWESDVSFGRTHRFIGDKARDLQLEALG